MGLGWVVATCAGVFIVAMIVWDWANRPNGVVLPPSRDDDWHDWPPSAI
jgi:hypothetical protein